MADLAAVDLVGAEPPEDFKMFFRNRIKKVHDEDVLKCPRCKKDMEKLKKNDVIIDICKKCNGMWLDDGEIHKLADMSKGDKHGK